jgi:hypothetical protein
VPEILENPVVRYLVRLWPDTVQSILEVNVVTHPDCAASDNAAFAHKQVAGTCAEALVLVRGEVHGRDVVQLELTPLDVGVSQVGALARSRALARVDRLAELRCRNVAERFRLPGTR